MVSSQQQRAEIGADEVAALLNGGRQTLGQPTRTIRAQRIRLTRRRRINQREEFAYGTNPNSLPNSGSSSLDRCERRRDAGLPTTQVVNTTFAVNYYAFFTGVLITSMLGLLTFRNSALTCRPGQVARYAEVLGRRTASRRSACRIRSSSTGKSTLLPMVITVPNI
jgi:hypothetical protein